MSGKESKRQIMNMVLKRVTLKNKNNSERWFKLSWDAFIQNMSYPLGDFFIAIKKCNCTYLWF